MYVKLARCNRVSKIFTFILIGDIISSLYFMHFECVRYTSNRYESSTIQSYRLTSVALRSCSAVSFDLQILIVQFQIIWEWWWMHLLDIKAYFQACPFTSIYISDIRKILRLFQRGHLRLLEVLMKRTSWIPLAAHDLCSTASVTFYTERDNIPIQRPFC